MLPFFNNVTDLLISDQLQLAKKIQVGSVILAEKALLMEPEGKGALQA